MRQLHIRGVSEHILFALGNPVRQLIRGMRWGRAHFSVIAVDRKGQAGAVGSSRAHAKMRTHVQQRERHSRTHPSALRVSRKDGREAILTLPIPWRSPLDQASTCACNDSCSAAIQYKSA